MECDHCKNKFKTQSSLNYHKNNAKYCLQKRKQVNKDLVCQECQKSFSSKHWFNQHKNKCSMNIDKIKNSYDKIYQENNQLKTINNMLESQIADQKYRYEQQVKELQDKLENIAVKAVSRPTHTTSNKTQINNFIQQLQPVTEEKLKESVTNLTIDHIKKGPEGYAQYALDYPLKDKMICVDYSRRKVKFKDKDGNVITDPEMTGLASKFFNSIKDKNKELICVYANELKEKLGDDNIMDTMVKIFDYKMAVDRGSEGEKTEFHHDFVRQMCSQTIKE
jgi:hypothetical protein